MSVVTFSALLDAGFEIAFHSHAEAILGVDFPEVAAQLEGILLTSTISIEEIVGSGGGETKGTQRLRRALHDHGWRKHKFEITRAIDGVAQVDPAFDDCCGTPLDGLTNLKASMILGSFSATGDRMCVLPSWTGTLGAKTMTLATKASRAAKDVRLSYQTIRNLTAPEEKEIGVQTYFTNVPVTELAKVSTGHNLRSYIAEHSPRKRNQVHRAIRKTIEEEHLRFINRNSGVTVCCTDLEIDEKTKTVVLRTASLINGAQTQGEMLGFLEDLKEQGLAAPDFHVRMEINVDPDEASVIETAIARNTATSVKSISQAGARGVLKDLERSLRASTGLQITTSETDDVETTVDTKLLLQLARLLLPQELAPSQSEAEILKPYKNKEKCLQEFAEWYQDKDADAIAKQRYEFTVAIAPLAWKEYQAINKGESWNGHHLHGVTQAGGRAVRRDKGKVIWVAPGIVFPMMKAIAAFVGKDDKGGWTIDYPDLFDNAELISRAVKQFRSHGLDPYVMGRSVGAYEALITYTETIMQVLAAAEKR